ncbi:MAG: polysaccharide deacetylase family protein [Streptococcus parasanguinis]|nr:polysaccharide deacetylase family protein [Streptococcus parasanguinis]
MSKRRVPKKIKVLLGINALLLVCIFICSFLLIKRITQLSDGNTSGTAVTRSLDEHSSSIEWTRVKKPVKLPILMYHSVHNMAESEAANANLIVDPETFESQLKALKKAGYYTLTPEEAYRILAKNEVPKGKKYVWLTFDDGVEDFYTIVYPLLKKYKMTATNNIITDFTQKEKENVLTFDQIKEMKKAGLTFESHTVNHPDLANSSLETQKNELVASKRLLDKVLDQNTSVIVYPSGRYSQVTIDQAKKADYKLGLTTKNGLASSADGLYALKRIRFRRPTSAQLSRALKADEISVVEPTQPLRLAQQSKNN